MTQFVLLMPLALVAILLLAERLWPARSEQGDTQYNLMLWAFNYVLSVVVVSTCRQAMVHFADAAHGPTIDLGALPFWLGALIYVLAADLASYLFHRLEHGSPWLWRLHSLHHSDPCMNATSAKRHHWGAAFLDLAVTTPVTAILLRPTTGQVAVFAIASLWVFVCHSNLNLHAGPLNWLLNSPNFHRIHHSKEPEHFNRNFANIFSLWDLLLGKYLSPVGPAPPTGTLHRPNSIGEALVWPFLPRSAEG